jgi:hypothetical protein
MFNRIFPELHVSDCETAARLYFEPEDIHGLVDELRAKGFTVSEPAPTDYGALTACMTGPDGYMIWFQQWTRVPPVIIRQ